MDTQSFLDALFLEIKTQIEGNPFRSMLAAHVGVLLRDKFPDWRQLGFERVGEVLEKLERDGKIQRGLNQRKALSVWLPGHRPTTYDVQGTIDQKLVPAGALINHVWRAFVSPIPEGRRFISRKGGWVTLGLKESPVPVDDWAEIIPIPDDEQQRWAREFLAQRGLDTNNAVAAALQKPAWFVEFPQALTHIASELRQFWNRMRSERVKEEVVKWNKGAKISERFLFEGELSNFLVPSDGRDLQITLSQPSESETSPNTSCNESERIRSAILQAVSKMTTEELFEIKIPVRLLLEALRPKLVSGQQNER